MPALQPDLATVRGAQGEGVPKLCKSSILYSTVARSDDNVAEDVQALPQQRNKRYRHSAHLKQRLRAIDFK